MVYFPNSGKILTWLGQNLPSFLMQYTSHGHWSISLMLFANCKKREEKRDFNKKFLFSTKCSETFGVTCICTCFRLSGIGNFPIWQEFERDVLFFCSLLSRYYWDASFIQLLASWCWKCRRCRSSQPASERVFAILFWMFVLLDVDI